MEKMNVQNTVYSGVKPESPIAIPIYSMGEKLQVFAPVAGYEQAGIASFLDEHFSIVNGKVKIKKSLIDSLITSYSTLTTLLSKVSDGRLASEMGVVFKSSDGEEYADTVTNFIACIFPYFA